ncbi:MAG: MBL fold metallo-hydrolase [Dysgonamonadaceae bacterium]|nr:MBL fold metallo-hydrolase [Dysgonamonadaceae bacterium]
MKVRFLGTGTSTGNPEIGCRCKVCSSTDERDRRFRSSVLIETGGKHLLIDCGPDFRMQMLETFRTMPVERWAGVLITHEHYDHVGGLDDLRTFCRNEAVAVYAENYVAEAIKTRMPYAFEEHRYPGVPNLRLVPVRNEPFSVEGIQVNPVRLMHGELPILGYRIGGMAYLTDLKTIPDEEYAKLKDLDVLIINALRETEHIAHETLADALANIKRIKPARAYLIHMCHQFGLHEEQQKTLPVPVFIAYDGLEIYV